MDVGTPISTGIRSFGTAERLVRPLETDHLRSSSQCEVWLRNIVGLFGGFALSQDGDRYHAYIPCRWLPLDQVVFLFVDLSVVLSMNEECLDERKAMARVKNIDQVRNSSI